jgi:hypothetical protein
MTELNKHPDNGRVIKLVPAHRASCSGCIGNAAVAGGDGSCPRLPDCIKRADDETRWGVWQYADESSLDTSESEARAYKPTHGGYPDAQPLARNTDPQTSHDAAATIGGGKLVDLILRELSWPAAELAGMTGKELANRTGRSLNSITPRLAPLRRAGLIHADGKRDKQIVWKLGNGVQA